MCQINSPFAKHEIALGESPKLNDVEMPLLSLAEAAWLQPCRDKDNGKICSSIS